MPCYLSYQMSIGRCRIQARTEVGMQASVDEGLMPALSKSRKYISGAPMSATALTALTRELFTQLNVDEEFPKSISFPSHTPLEYSRDALAGPLYRLEHGLPHHTRNSMGTSGNVFEDPLAQASPPSTFLEIPKNLASSSCRLRPAKSDFVSSHFERMLSCSCRLIRKDERWRVMWFRLPS